MSDNFSALALVIEASPLGRMMGNVYFSVARLAIPTHLFVDEAPALEWLKKHGASDPALRTPQSGR